MYKTIILDCQTKTSETSCEDCIVYKQCKTKKTTAEKNACALQIAVCNNSIVNNKSSIVSLDIPH
jgi:hypothetical protein